MKTYYSLLFLLLLMSVHKAIAQSPEYQCIVVETTDGERLEYLLSDNPRIAHMNALVVITSNTVSVEFPSSNVSKVYLSTSTDAIGNVKTTEGKILLHKDVIVMKDFCANEPISLYGADGKQLWQQSADGSGQLVFSLNSLSQGIYIIKTNHQSFKIIRK